MNTPNLSHLPSTDRRRTPTLEIRLFGDLELTCDGVPVRFGAPPRSLELLAYLALHRSAPSSREKLAALMWPDALDSDARADVRRHLYYLNTRALPETGIEWFVGDKRTIAINPEIDVRIDVEAFERLAADPAQAGEAIALYRGDLVPVLQVEWIDPIRERLRDDCLQLIDETIVRANDPSLRASLAQRALAIDPWRESAIRALMQARRALGDRAGAASAYREFVQRMNDDLGIEPTPETRAVYDAAVLAPPRKSRGTIPTRLTRFFGRDIDFGELTRLFADRPIVTLVGTGGVGKTRLAQEFARRTGDRFRDGAAFAELAPVADAQSVTAAIASAVGVREEYGVDLGEAVAASLRSAELLLVIDNCEHVVDAAAALVERLASSAPGVRFLATSREPLRVEGEHLYRLTTLANESASDLFADRAASVGASEPTPIERTSISSICARLDGIPLAIELAAARAYTFAIPEIERRLDNVLDLLREGRRTADPRQQTLRALIDWSVDLLEPDDRRAFVRCGVFTGRFSVHAANAVCDAVAPLDVLVHKSLVVREESLASLLETTRAYARERLARDDDASAAYERMVRYALHIARGAQATFRLVPRRMWLDSFSAEMDTIRAALSWAFAHEEYVLLACELAAEIDLLMWDASLGVEGSRWISRALSALPADAPAALVARCWLAASWLFADSQDRLAAADRAFKLAGNLATPLLRARANLAYAYSGQYYAERRDANVKALKRARKIATPLGDTFTLSYVAHLLGDVHYRAGEDAAGDALYAESIELYRRSDDDRGLSHLKINQAENAFRRGEVQRAIELGGEALDAMRSADDRRYLPFALANLANYHIFVGSAHAGSTFAREGFAIARDGNFPMENAVFTGVFAALAGLLGDWNAAARLSASTEAQYTTLGMTRDPAEATVNARLLADIDAHLDASIRARHVAEGASADPHALIDAFVATLAFD